MQKTRKLGQKSTILNKQGNTKENQLLNIRIRQRTKSEKNSLILRFTDI